MRNCPTVFQCDPLLSGVLAYNQLTNQKDLVKPIGYERGNTRAATDTGLRYIRLYLEETYGLTSEKKILDAAELAARQNSFHPVRDYLNSLSWDGTERICYCLRHFLEADVQPGNGTLPKGTPAGRSAPSCPNMKVVQYVMGHANINVTMEVYNHITERARIENEIAKMDTVQVV